MLWVSVFLVVTACATSPSTTSEVSPPGDSGLMGLKGDAPVDWWRARAAVDAAERPVLSGWVAFDARAVVDPSTRELVWQSLNAVLSGYGQAASLIARAELEPGSAGTWDVYFVVNEATQREGVLWRLSRSKPVVTLNVLLHRGGGGADEIVVWVVPALQGVEALSLRWVLRGGECLTGLLPALGEVEVLQASAGCAMEVGVLVPTLFDRVSHAGYLTDVDAARPPTFVPEDLPLRDRTLDEVFSGSVFPPRMTSGPPRNQK